MSFLYRELYCSAEEPRGMRQRSDRASMRVREQPALIHNDIHTANVANTKLHNLWQTKRLRPAVGHTRRCVCQFWKPSGVSNHYLPEEASPPPASSATVCHLVPCLHSRVYPTAVQFISVGVADEVFADEAARSRQST